MFEAETDFHVSKKTFSKGQTWGALKKAWKAYKIANIQKDDSKMEYATRIRTLQGELSIKQSEFPNLGLR